MTDVVVENRVTGVAVLHGQVQGDGSLEIVSRTQEMTPDLVESIFNQIQRQMEDGYDAGLLEPAYYEWEGLER